MTGIANNGSMEDRNQRQWGLLNGVANNEAVGDARPRGWLCMQ